MLDESDAHSDQPRIHFGRELGIQSAGDAGIRKLLTIGNGSGPDQMGCGIALAEAHDWIYTSVGVHPHDAAKMGDEHYLLMEQLSKHPKVVAIGETGLDYYYDNSPRDIQ